MVQFVGGDSSSPSATNRFPIAADGGAGLAPAANFPASTMFKVILKTVALLVIFFVMLYVGMKNTHGIEFHFPVAGTTAQEPIQAPAALIFFGVFAVGVLAGTILTYGEGRGRKSAAKDR